MKKFFIFSASVLILSVIGYNVAYWLVIATSRLSGAKIVSLNVSEFFTYQIVVALMFIFCGLYAVILAQCEEKLRKKASGIITYSIALAVVFAAAALCITARFLILKSSASAANGEQSYLFLSSLSYATWGNIGALSALTAGGLRYLVLSCSRKKLRIQ